jgi:hypothetical protein
MIELASSIIIKEIKVIKPMALPDRPKSNCSMGALLFNKIKIPSVSNKNASMVNFLKYGSANEPFSDFKIVGTRYSARQKKTITFGITSESLFKPGVMIKVIVMTPKIKIFSK